MSEIEKQGVEQIQANAVSCARCGFEADVYTNTGICDGCNDELAEERAKANTAQEAQNQPGMDHDSYTYTDPSSISMTVIPKDTAHELGLRTVFGKTVTIADLEAQAERYAHELRIEGKSKSTYNLSFLLKFLKTADKVSGYVTIEFSTDEPLKATCRDSNGKELRFYLAPCMED